MLKKRDKMKAGYWVLKRLQDQAVKDADAFEESHLRLLEWLNLNHAGYFWAHEVWKESRRCLNLMRGEQWRLQRKMKLFKRKCLQLKFKLEEPLMFFFLSISRLIPPKILNRFHVNIIKILQDLEQPQLPGVEVTAAKAAKEHSLRFLFGTNWFSSSLKLKNLDLQRICGTCLETLNLEFRIRNKSLESKKIIAFEMCTLKCCAGSGDGAG